VNGTRGWREWPGATYVGALGCYAWQVGCTSFSDVLVVKAIGESDLSKSSVL
jgi:hypothetical protein